MCDVAVLRWHANDGGGGGWIPFIGGGDARGRGTRRAGVPLIHNIGDDNM